MWKKELACNTVIWYGTGSSPEMPSNRRRENKATSRPDLAETIIVPRWPTTQTLAEAKVPPISARLVGGLLFIWNTPCIFGKYP